MRRRLPYFQAAASLIACMLQDHAVTRDALYAAGATFTPLARAFAFAFSVCQQAMAVGIGLSEVLPLSSPA